MAQRKSVKLSTRPVHVSDSLGGGTKAVSGDFIPAETPLTNATGTSGIDPGYGFLAQTVYGTVYALSFGCVLTAMLVSRIVPGQEILSRGIGDGARAAKRLATGMGKQPHEMMDCEPRKQGGGESLRTA